MSYRIISPAKYVLKSYNADDINHNTILETDSVVDAARMGIEMLGIYVREISNGLFLIRYQIDDIKKEKKIKASCFFGACNRALEFYNNYYVTRYVDPYIKI